MWNELFISPGGHSQRSCCQELCVSDLDWVGGPHCYYSQRTITSFGNFSVNHDLISSFDSIDDNMQVKITDNALARDLFPMDYHCLGDNENRPVRWMALESLLNNDFSSLSDVVISSMPCTVWNNKWISAIFGLDGLEGSFKCVWYILWQLAEVLEGREQHSSLSCQDKQACMKREAQHIWKETYSIYILSSFTWQWRRHAHS